MARLLTFRFDDGFMVGARTSARILGPYRGSYFIVGDRTLGSADLDANPQLSGRDFGSVMEWRAIAELGHDVQPHSYSHRRFSDLSLVEAERDIRRSVDVVRSITGGPFVFAFPFNDTIGGIDWPTCGLAAAGFATCSSAKPIQFNDLANFDPFMINSWAVRERDWPRIAREIGTVPDGTWTVLAFHSLDGEGFEPWSSDGFARLVALTVELGFHIVTTRDVVARAAAS